MSFSLPSVRSCVPAPVRGTSLQRRDSQDPCTYTYKCPQSVHEPMLTIEAGCSEGSSPQEVITAIVGGRTKEYCDWWREQAIGQDNLSLFSVRLIGDARCPQLFTPLAPSDLAFCSKWGHNRVVDQHVTGKPVELVLPVLTRPDIVEQAVAGILSGQVSLSLSNVEALLVFANAVGFETLEAACMGYLSDQAQHMDAAGLLRLAQLAEHLGLLPLLDTAADHLIALPWHANLSALISLLKFPVYASDTGKCSLLLHGPRRGACTELQVLAVLEGLGIPRARCTPYIQLQNLQPAELTVLVSALLNSEEDPGQLLHAAAKQRQVPKALRQPSWSKNVRMIHKILLPAPDSRDQYFALPECNLALCVGRRSDLDGQETLAVFVHPARPRDHLKDIMHHGTFFALHPAVPYATCFESLSPAECQSLPAGHRLGLSDYLSKLQELYAPDYPGPFTIGIWWQEPARNVAD